MAATSLKRKARKNRTVARKRVDNIQRLQQKPVIKNVDIEAIKAEFAEADKKKPAAKKAEKEVKAEKTEETKAKKTEAPKAKKAAAPKKKAATKKTEDKTED